MDSRNRGWRQGDQGGGDCNSQSKSQWWLSQDRSVWNGEHWADWAHVLVVEPLGFADGLNVRGERKKETEEQGGSCREARGLGRLSKRCGGHSRPGVSCVTLPLKPGRDSDLKPLPCSTEGQCLPKISPSLRGLCSSGHLCLQLPASLLIPPHLASVALRSLL